MKNHIITFSVCFVATLLAVVLGVWLVGSQSADAPLGGTGITRYPNSGMAMRFLTLTSTPGSETTGTDGKLTVGSIDSSGLVEVDRIAFGGTPLTTLTGAATSSLSAAQFCAARTVAWASAASGQLTLPDAQPIISAGCLTTPGETKLLYYRNTGVVTASTTQFKTPASSTIAFASSTASTATTTLNGGDTAWFLVTLVTTTQSESNMIEWNQVQFHN